MEYPLIRGEVGDGVFLEKGESGIESILCKEGK